MQWRTQDFFWGFYTRNFFGVTPGIFGGFTPGIFRGASTNSVEDRGQRERGSEGGSPQSGVTIDGQMS
jgi:hypothetical protein